MTPADAPTEALADAEARAAQDVLEGGEIIILITRPSVRLIPAFAVMPLAFLLIAACAVWAAKLTGVLSAEKVDGMLLALGCVATLVVVVQVYRWRRRRYLLTNYRAIRRVGLLHTKVNQARLAELTSVEVIQFPPEQLTGLGTVCFQGKEGFRTDLNWGNLANPEEIADEIRKAMRHNHAGRG